MLPSIVAQSNLTAMCALAETVPHGAFAEIGVFHGGSAWQLYQVTTKQNRELRLFDTFTGTPVNVPGLDSHKIDKEFADIDAPGRISKLMPTARLHIGIYPATHPLDMPDVAFIHCDCDQYDSYRAVIDIMWAKCAVPGAIMLFDDYPYLAGAKKAVDESFRLDELYQCGTRYYVVKS